MKITHMWPFRSREPEKSLKKNPKNIGNRCGFCGATSLTLHTRMQNQDADENYSSISEITQSKYS